MEQKSNAFLEKEKLSTLMRKYSLPCVISLVVAALYNIVDQIFIANADYLGSYGNAANTVVFPLTVVALAIAVMIGDGACAFVSISLGADRKEDAHRSIGNAIILCLGSSLILTAVYLLAMERILTFFGGRVNAETYACAKEYFFWISLGKAGLSMILSLVREIIFGVFLPILLPMFFGLDGVLYSFPTADVLTFIFTVVVILRVFCELSEGSGLEKQITEIKANT